jgi:hypothetical protein
MRPPPGQLPGAPGEYRLNPPQVHNVEFSGFVRAFQPLNSATSDLFDQVDPVLDQISR